HLQSVLAAIAAEPGRRIDSVALLTAAERHELLVDWAPRIRFGGGRLHVLFAEVARRRGDAIAVSCGPRALSYRELDERANRVAHYLRARGVGRGTIVGVYAERGLDLIVGIVAILKAGGAYLPIDVGYPAERVAFMLKDAAVGVVVSQQGLAGRLAG